MDNLFIAKLRLILTETADQYSRGDRGDFDLHGEVGGNLDDAYELGKAEGEIEFARTLLNIVDELEEQEIGRG